MKKTYLMFALLGAALVSSCEYGDGTYDNSSYSNYAGNDAYYQDYTGDNYAESVENPFVLVSEQPVSTFSIDADGASYANVRRFIQQDNMLPPAGAVRTEELINYFNLDYPYTDASHPINLNGEVSVCPWNTSHKLIRIGMKAKDIPEAELPSSNYVLLIDVSGSMSSADKLALLKQGFVEFVNQMKDTDRVAIVTYAGQAGVHLESTAGTDKPTIIAAIESLGSGGSTNGAEGIITAYEIAEQNFIEGGNNRVILGTDGDFNVGASSQDELVTLIEEKRDLGVFLTVLGVGRGNYNDATMEQVANHGNGTFEYIDKVDQMMKVFVHEYSKFFTVAKDVKIQLEFSPENVEAYRLIGYENRALSQEDFEDDEEDAGEIGANQNITALYEIIPKEEHVNYWTTPMFTVDCRYKNPDEDVSIPMQTDIYDEGHSFVAASAEMKFCTAVTGYAMLLIDSQYKEAMTYDDIINWLNAASLSDPHMYKSEFLNIVQQTKALAE